MKLVFHSKFRGAPWPGPLGYGDTARPGVLGELWVGPEGLLGALETAVGLPPPRHRFADRARALAERLPETPGFWSASAAADPLGTARTLLARRDWLLLHGWSPTGRSRKGRVAELARLCRDLPPGRPERIDALIAELADPGARAAGKGRQRRRRSAPDTLHGLEVVLLGETRAALPARWQRLLEAVETAGARLTETPVGPPGGPAAPEARREGGQGRGRRRGVGRTSGTDLQRCLAPDFTPTGDGSLQLLRPAGPLAAAEAVAAYLASLPPEDWQDGTVILGGDALLDAALEAFGLPTTAAAALGDASPLGAVLPLSLGLLWEPHDPESALALLRLPTSPIPRGLAWRLADALAEWPALGSDAWQAALADGLSRYEDPARREAVAARLDALFAGPTFRDAAPVAEVLARVTVIERWARGRLEASQRAARAEVAASLHAATPGPRRARGEEDEDEALEAAGASAELEVHAYPWDADRSTDPPDAPSSETEPLEDAPNARARPSGPTPAAWGLLLAQCARLRAHLSAHPAETVDRIDLDRIVAEACDVGAGATPQPAQAGLARIASPFDLAGPARRVIWWNFYRTTGARPPQRLWSPQELDTLMAHGLQLPEASATAERLREAWLRPFALTREQLLLVCPHQNAYGEEAAPHAVWDEIVAGLDAAAAARLEGVAPRGLAPARKLASLPLPEPQPWWQRTDEAPIPGPDALSPSALETLLGCPFAWVLEHVMQVGSAVLSLPQDALLHGRLAHWILERVFGGPGGHAPPPPPEAEARAQGLLDAELPRLAAPLLQPGAGSQRLVVREHIAWAAGALAEALAALSPTPAIAATEARLSRKWRGRTLRGRLDLHLADPPLVLDFKWGGGSYYRGRLEQGTALQLAIYAYLVGGSRGDLPAVGYLSVRDRRIMVSAAADLPPDHQVEAPDLRRTLRAAHRALEGVTGAFAQGTAACPGTPEEGDPPKKAEITEGEVLILAPPCSYCDYGVLCGKEVA